VPVRRKQLEFKAAEADFEIDPAPLAELTAQT
jgi:hypothetical protein